MSSPSSVMKFNHVSFPSRDVNATAAFFVQHLGCTATSFGTSQILKRQDFDIVIEDASDRDVQWPQNFHIGFELQSVAGLTALFGNLQKAGVTFATDIVKHPRGSRFFCWIPGGIMVEINTREDADEVYRAGFGLA